RVEAVDVGVPRHGERILSLRQRPARPQAGADRQRRSREHEVTTARCGSHPHSSTLGSPTRTIPPRSTIVNQGPTSRAWQSHWTPRGAISLRNVPSNDCVRSKNGTKGASCMSTLENVSGVLRLFSAERSTISVSEAAQLLGLPKSSTSRLLKGMARVGLLTSFDGKPGYRVGNLVFETSRRHRSNSTLSLSADDATGQIAKATGHTGYV